jgi:hypothetical protein
VWFPAPPPSPPPSPPLRRVLSSPAAHRVFAVGVVGFVSFRGPVVDASSLILGMWRTQRLSAFAWIAALAPCLDVALLQLGLSQTAMACAFRVRWLLVPRRRLQVFSLPVLDDPEVPGSGGCVVLICVGAQHNLVLWPASGAAVPSTMSPFLCLFSTIPSSRCANAALDPQHPRKMRAFSWSWSAFFLSPNHSPAAAGAYAREAPRRHLRPSSLCSLVRSARPPSPGARSRFLGAATPIIPRARAPFLLYGAGNAAKASPSVLSPAPRAACRSGHGVPSGHLLLVLVLNSPRTQSSVFRRRCWLPVLSSWRGVRSVFPAGVIDQLLFMNSLELLVQGKRCCKA